jgi:hypothetical protein
MPATLAKKSLFFQMSAVIAAAAGGMLVARYLGAKRINSAERLADALLHTDALRETPTRIAVNQAHALADCALYFLNAAHYASEGIGFAGREEDAKGDTRTANHPYTHAHATIITEEAESEQVLTYTVRIPDVGEAQGTRRVGAERLSGVTPVRPISETMQIAIGEEYTAQMEADWQVGDYLVFGKTHLFGTVSLRDGAGNSARIHVGEDGKVSGTITNDAKIVGRFDGVLGLRVNYRANELEEA